MSKLEYHYLGNPDVISQSLDRTIEASLRASGTKVFCLFTCFQHSILHEEISINEKMPLFSKSHKNPAEIVKILRDNLAILEKQDKKTDKV